MNFNQTTSPSLVLKPKSTKLPGECKICGAPALYSYVGVVVCDPCKMFFKRNAQREPNHFTCVYNNQCEIHSHTRPMCSSCRLAKCLDNGMQVRMLRSCRITKNKTKRKDTNQSQMLPTLNRLRSDQSTLSVNQWNLLSNLVHCYDEHSGISYAQQFLQEQNHLPPKMRFKLASIGEFFTSIVNKGQLLYENNANFISLCSHDRSVLLHHTMEYVSALGSCLMAHHTRIFDHEAFYTLAEMFYGSTTLTYSIRAVNQLDSDSTFVKLILALLTFSTFDYMYDNSKTTVHLMDRKVVFDIQNTYIDLIWRYLVYKYDYERTVRCFSNLIRCLFLSNQAFLAVREHQQYTNMIDSLVKQTEETLILTECSFRSIK